MSRTISARYAVGARLCDYFTILGRTQDKHLILLCDKGHQRTCRLANARQEPIPCKECGDAQPRSKEKRPVGRPPRTDTLANRAFHNDKMYAKRINTPFTLSFSEYHELSKRNCAYCGRGPDKALKDHEYIGLTTFKPELGFVEGNVLTTCKNCRQLKGRQSHDAFIIWVNQVVHRQNL